MYRRSISSAGAAMQRFVAPELYQSDNRPPGGEAASTPWKCTPVRKGLDPLNFNLRTAAALMGEG
jgi:hypothetical protein